MALRRAWLKESAGKPQPRQVPDKTVVMRVWNEYWEALAVWSRRANVWACVQAAPTIRWMLGKDRLTVKNELLKRGCKWEKVTLTLAQKAVRTD
jgi:hypothetical protein